MCLSNRLHQEYRTKRKIEEIKFQFPSFKNYKICPSSVGCRSRSYTSTTTIVCCEIAVHSRATTERSPPHRSRNQDRFSQGEKLTQSNFWGAARYTETIDLSFHHFGFALLQHAASSDPHVTNDYPNFGYVGRFCEFSGRVTLDARATTGIKISIRIKVAQYKNDQTQQRDIGNRRGRTLVRFIIRTCAFPVYIIRVLGIPSDEMGG